MTQQATAVFDGTTRVCESCGGAMPSRMSRQRDEKGNLVCDSCKSKNTPHWASAHAETLLLVSPDSRAEFFRREAEAVSSILRIERWKDSIASYAAGGDLTVNPATGDLHAVSDLMRVAHDMGDGGVVNHCPFCGSGAVVGGSDGSVECGFCHTVFSVQVQPSNPSMPQTVNGQPFVPPGMPAGEPTEMSEPKDPVAEQADQQEGEDPSGAQQPKAPGHPSGGDPNPSSADMISDRQANPPHEKAKVQDAVQAPPGAAKDKDGNLLPGAKPGDKAPNPFAKDGDPSKAQPGAKGDPKRGDTPLDPKDPVLYVPEDAPAGQGKPDPHQDGDKPKDKGGDSNKDKNLPPWMKKKKAASAVLGSFRTPDGMLDGEAYMKRLALQFADDRSVVLAEIRSEAEDGYVGPYGNRPDVRAWQQERLNVTYTDGSPVKEGDHIRFHQAPGGLLETHDTSDWKYGTAVLIDSISPGIKEMVMEADEPASWGGKPKYNLYGHVIERA